MGRLLVILALALVAGGSSAATLRGVLSPPPSPAWLQEFEAAGAALSKYSNYSYAVQIGNFLVRGPESVQNKTITVFIPSNRAILSGFLSWFSLLSQGYLYASRGGQYFYALGNFPLAKLLSAAPNTALPTAAGVTLAVGKVNQGVVIGTPGLKATARILNPDIYVGMHIVYHGIDAVLVPPPPATPFPNSRIPPPPPPGAKLPVLTWEQEMRSMAHAAYKISNYSFDNTLYTLAYGQYFPSYWGQHVTRLTPNDRAAQPSLFFYMLAQGLFVKRSAFINYLRGRWTSAQLSALKNGTQLGTLSGVMITKVTLPVSPQYPTGGVKLVAPFSSAIIETPNIFIGNYWATHGVTSPLLG